MEAIVIYMELCVNCLNGSGSQVESKTPYKQNNNILTYTTSNRGEG